MSDKLAYQAFTFDDVLLEPRYSDVVPAEVNVSAFDQTRSSCFASAWSRASGVSVQGRCADVSLCGFIANLAFHVAINSSKNPSAASIDEMF